MVQAYFGEKILLIVNKFSLHIFKRQGSIAAIKNQSLGAPEAKVPNISPHLQFHRFIIYTVLSLMKEIPVELTNIRFQVQQENVQ